MRFFASVMACIMAFTVNIIAYGEVHFSAVEARACILIERKSGRVLYEMNADELLPMASTTKIMTALLTLERCDLSEIVTASKNASAMPGTSIYLGEGEQLTVYQMLQGLLLRSGNDCAVALAEHMSGSVKEFAYLMNERAKALDARAHFVNPEGLDIAGHLTSARGLALIANEAMDFPLFRTLVQTERETLPWANNRYERVLSNKNKLLKSYSGATGVKTGFTKKAGRCLVFSAEREGMELLGVLLNCANWFDAAAKLMDEAFDRYHMETVMQANEIIKQIPIPNGMKNKMDIIAQQSMSIPVAEGERISVVIKSEEQLTAPLGMGQVVGCVEGLIDGEWIQSRPLVTREAVTERTWRNALMKIISKFNPIR